MAVRPLHSAIDKVYRMANLAEASRKVCANKGTPGVDGQTAAAWRAKEAENLRRLHGELYKDRYRSKQVRRQYIPKPGSKKKRPKGSGGLRTEYANKRYSTYSNPYASGCFVRPATASGPGGASTRRGR